MSSIPSLLLLESLLLLKPSVSKALVFLVMQETRLFRCSPFKNRSQKKLNDVLNTVRVTCTVCVKKYIFASALWAKNMSVVYLHTCNVYACPCIINEWIWNTNYNGIEQGWREYSRYCRLHFFLQEEYTWNRNVNTHIHTFAQMKEKIYEWEDNEQITEKVKRKWMIKNNKISFQELSLFN